MSAGADVAALRRQERLVLTGSAGFITAFAWFALLRTHGFSLRPEGMSQGVPTAEPSIERFLLSAGAWMIMMIAMMTPAVLPWITFVAKMTRNRSPGGSLHLPVALFATAYFTVWGVFSVLGAGTQLLLHHFIQDLSAKSVSVLGGSAFIVAGAYQWSPLKSACLRHCRSPLGFFLSSWREGPTGFFAMGLRHGAYCLGCCWAVMALMLAVGTTSLVWMVILTMLIVIEQLILRGPTVGRAAGWILTGAGVWFVSGAGL